MIAPSGDARHQVVLDFIADYVATHHYPPTRREIQEMLGARSPATAQVTINKMIEEGLITIAPGIARSVAITGTNMKQTEEGHG